MELITAIVAGDEVTASGLLRADPGRATTAAVSGATRGSAREFYLPEIAHYLYAGDTPLHIAAAAYRAAIIDDLVRFGADVTARNRRGAQPLHYAVDGVPGTRTWDPLAQRAAVAALLAAGADPNAPDSSGVSPLHRAVRNRCADAVAELLDGGADPRRPNRSGSTPWQLATSMTGRGGSGSAEARMQQQAIMELLRSHGGG